MASGLFQLADHKLGGRLLDELSSRRAAGHSNESIARWLDRATGVDVKGETVRRWVRDYLPTAEEPAA